MKNIFYLFCIAILMSSCSFEQKIHFNNDWSGDAQLVMDFSAMVAVMPPDSTGENPLSEMTDSFSEMQERLEAISGVSEVSIDIDKEGGKYDINFDFASIEALNKALSGGGDMSNLLSNKEHTSFQLKGNNKLIFEVPNMSDLGEDKEIDTSQLGQAGQLMRYKIDFSFDRDVKKIKTKNGGVIKGERVIQDVGIDSMMDPKFKGAIQISLGK